ncbi:hypothetical protein GCM10010116_39850 [Microbispora rosea subsp. aerata]|nr:hypothetical protein GCM10010116_39850 [Microbispora rosea subsp. aerata]
MPVAIPGGLAAIPPGAELAGLLEGIDVERVSGFDTVEVLKAAYRQACHDRARFLQVLLEVGLREPWSGQDVARLQVPDEFAPDEARAALVWSRRRADSAFELAWNLHRRLPVLGQAMLDGRLDEPRAVAFIRWTTGLTDDQASWVCEHLVHQASSWTVGELIEHIQRLVLAIDPQWAEKRYKEAVRRRRVAGTRNDDGTATVSGLDLPLERAVAGCERIDELARACKRAGDLRPIDHIRADLFLGSLDGSFEGLSDDQIIAHVRAHPFTDPNDTTPGTADTTSTPDTTTAPADTSTGSPGTTTATGSPGTATALTGSGSPDTATGSPSTAAGSPGTPKGCPDASTGTPGTADAPTSTSDAPTRAQGAPTGSSGSATGSTGAPAGSAGTPTSSPDLPPTPEAADGEREGTRPGDCSRADAATVEESAEETRPATTPRTGLASRPEAGVTTAPGGGLASQPEAEDQSCAAVRGETGRDGGGTHDGACGATGEQADDPGHTPENEHQHSAGRASHHYPRRDPGQSTAPEPQHQHGWDTGPEPEHEHERSTAPEHENEHGQSTALGLEHEHGRGIAPEPEHEHGHSTALEPGREHGRSGVSEPEPEPEDERERGTAPGPEMEPGCEGGCREARRSSR